MTELNQQTLRGILARITSVNEKYIVPKQGNWWNPQERAAAPDTWCAYIIRSNKPRTMPFYNVSTDGMTNGVVTEKIASIDLQFVGPQAETIAQSVALWPLRQDVADALKTVQGALLNTDMEARSSNFYQDGANNVVAWNVSIKVLWFQGIDTTQGRMPIATLNGTIQK